MYGLNPVRIRQGVIWAQLPSFGCPCWMKAPVERGEEKPEEEAEEQPSVFCTSQILVVFSLYVNGPGYLCYHNPPLSLSLSLSNTRMHDSCVCLGKCLWRDPTPQQHLPDSSHPPAPFFRPLTHLQLPIVTSCTSCPAPKCALRQRWRI